MALALLSLPLESMPAPRPRAVAFGKHAHVYSPPKYKAWQAEAARLLAAIPTEEDWELLEGPVRVIILVALKLPKKTVRVAPPGDVDNHAKSILDVITKDGRFWKDDTQVTDLRVLKEWTADEPFIKVTIRSL